MIIKSTDGYLTLLLTTGKTLVPFQFLPSTIAITSFIRAMIIARTTIIYII